MRIEVEERTILCDTSRVPVTERADLWADAVSKLFVPLECTPKERVSFRGRMRAGSVGPVALCDLDVSPHTIRRTRQLAANTNGDQYKLSLMLSGEALIEQDRHEAVLRKGDFAIYDCSRPYVLVGGEHFRMLVCVLPRDIVGLTTEQIGHITATQISGDVGVAWAMAPFLTRLADLAIRDEMPTDVYRLVESIVDLVESLCATALGANDGAHPQSRAELMLRIRAYINAHLGDPALTPAGIASAHFVSKRLLHKLFEAQGTSVSRWIREQRLERCREDLSNPHLRDETISTIGIRWGLENSAHFSRLFRDQYGRSPSELRHEAFSEAEQLG